MDSAHFEQHEATFRNYLRRAGSKYSLVRRTVLQVLLSCEKPVSVMELLYESKKIDPLHVGIGAIYTTMKLLVESGIAKEVEGPDGTTLYTHELAIAQCSHVHLVCKDCGAVVEVQRPTLE